ncbi:glucosaminidase domain-containing protein [Dielma fastidiosa]|uniref:glucosaminidase domain-containing protein n=1 Tax=Dielma fastidiosa TaxID=1034346 RepID=UPI0036F338BC
MTNSGVDAPVDQVITPYDKIECFIVEKGLSLSIPNFYILALDYEIDPAFALATWILETGWGKDEGWQTRNNPGGIKCGETYCAFASKDEGLAMMFYTLHQYTHGLISWIGTKTTISEIRNTWNPASDDSTQIYQLMKEIIKS